MVHIYYDNFRTTSVFIAGNAETIIDFECVPTYSQTLIAQIVSMDENVIIPETSLKSGTVELPLCIMNCYIPYVTYAMFYILLKLKQ